MRQSLPFIFFLVLSTILWLGSSGGRASVFDQGNTGAPGDNFRTCQNCHSTGPIQVSLDILLRDSSGSLVNEYEPGENYTVTVKVRHVSGETPKGYGFQMVAINAAKAVNGDPYNAWTDTTLNVKLVPTSSGRVYAEHDGVSPVDSFLVNWSAPDSDIGPITLYSSGNGVNLNGRNSGDGASRASIQINPKGMVSTNQIKNEEWSFGPNPADQWIRIMGPEDGKQAKLQIYNQQGQLMISGHQSFNQDLDISTLPSGMYIIRFSDSSGRQQSSKLLKR